MLLKLLVSVSKVVKIFYRIVKNKNKMVATKALLDRWWPMISAISNFKVLKSVEIS